MSAFQSRRASPKASSVDQPMVSIIVPVYNEVRTIGAVIRCLLEMDFPTAREIVVVDDGSTDGTGEVLRAMEGTVDALSVTYARHNSGKGSAIRLGLARAQGSIVAIQDADLELDPAQLATLVAPILREETAVVYGSRFLCGRPDAPWLTIAANLTLTAVTNVLYGSSLTDMETCYKIMRIDVARSLRLQSDRFEIEPEITAKLLLRGHRILELPVRFNPRSRSAGKKMRWRDGTVALWELCRHRLRSR